MPIVRLSNEYIIGGFTPLDNVFISEYMKNAPENYVKIYLYGLFLSHSAKNTAMEDLCLGVDQVEKEVVSAYNYWQELGFCQIISEQPFEVVYLPISTSIAKPRKISETKYKDFTLKLQQIIDGRMISPNEFREFINVIELYHIQPEAVLLIAKYCCELKGNSINQQYILTVAKNFAHKEIKTLKAVEKELEGNNKQKLRTSELFKALKITRLPDFADNDMYSGWLALGFSHEAIICAANRTGKSSNLNKLNTFILELYKHKMFSETQILEYNKTRELLSSIAIEVNKALSVYYPYLDSEVENFILPWLNAGFDKDTLITIANYCFLRSVRTLKDMDFVVNKFAKLGLFTAENINKYAVEINIQEATIEKLLAKLNIARRASSFDKSSYNRWINWGFTEEVIFFASETALNAVNPMGYLNSVLSNYKDNGIYTVEKAKEHKAFKVDKDYQNKTDANAGFYTRELSSEQLKSAFDNILDD